MHSSDEKMSEYELSLRYLCIYSKIQAELNNLSGIDVDHDANFLKAIICDEYWFFSKDTIWKLLKAMVIPAENRLAAYAEWSNLLNHRISTVDPFDILVLNIRFCKLRDATLCLSRLIDHPEHIEFKEMLSKLSLLLRNIGHANNKWIKERNQLFRETRNTKYAQLLELMIPSYSHNAHNSKIERFLCNFFYNSWTVETVNDPTEIWELIINQNFYDLSLREDLEIDLRLQIAFLFNPLGIQQTLLEKFVIENSNIDRKWQIALEYSTYHDHGASLLMELFSGLQSNITFSDRLLIIRYLKRYKVVGFTYSVGNFQYLLQAFHSNDALAKIQSIKDIISFSPIKFHKIYDFFHFHLQNEHDFVSLSFEASLICKRLEDANYQGSYSNCVAVFLKKLLSLNQLELASMIAWTIEKNHSFDVNIEECNVFSKKSNNDALKQVLVEYKEFQRALLLCPGS